MQELSRKEIERMVEEILQRKGYIPAYENLATKDGIKMLKDDIKMLKDDIKLLAEMMDRRFTDLLHYVDKRFEDMNKRINMILSLLLSFNIPLLIAVIVILIKLVVL